MQAIPNLVAASMNQGVMIGDTSLSKHRRGTYEQLPTLKNWGQGKRIEGKMDKQNSIKMTVSE